MCGGWSVIRQRAEDSGCVQGSNGASRRPSLGVLAMSAVPLTANSQSGFGNAAMPAAEEPLTTLQSKYWLFPLFIFCEAQQCHGYTRSSNTPRSAAGEVTRVRDRVAPLKSSLYSDTDSGA